jgi:hypothetical protein
MARVGLAVVYLVVVGILLALADARNAWPWGVFMVVVAVLSVGVLLIAGDENVDRLNPFRRPRAK